MTRLPTLRAPSPRLRLSILLTLLASALPASAADASTINAGDTAWLLTSTALVLFMMIPGLALFYAGLVRSRNVLSIFMQCFALTAVLSLVWLVCGYSLSFSDGGSFIGSFQKMFLNGVTTTSVRSDCPTIPELLHFAYQMMFFLITPGLFIGAFAERMKFSAIMAFSVLWSLLVYVPCCYGVWHKAGAFFGLTGVIDLAGGIVVHITAGVAALVLCIVVKPRHGFPNAQFLPHNLPLTMVGAGMLWVGWFGFNAGSQLAANGSAAMTLIVTHISACTASVVWMAIEWLHIRKSSALGIATGSIAGLAAITPAAGKVGPIGALCIGATSAIICWLACAKLKKTFRYDDSLDVFGVHGVGGFVGTILVAVFGSTHFAGGLGDFEILPQLKTQALASLYTIVLSGVVSYALIKIIGLFVNLRVTQEQENQGLDLAEHGEAAYND
ncbi:ammonium transporter [Brevifollis gellanilyticus]|uniref:Ammonium transporter n=1 Tax=Brevifollis gellanilyticus TaxID=748831 RepID=A0A512MEG4_9BACT|nr:ammonium transporter [Brevifollis gellanilyticus]GEP45133.1 ammonium transporter [Brevifollis gellanilyticus]